MVGDGGLTMKLALRASRRCFSIAEWEALSSAVKDLILFLPRRLLPLTLPSGLPDALPDAGIVEAPKVYSSERQQTQTYETD